MPAGSSYPGFVRPGVTADGFAFLDHSHISSLEAFAQLCQFALFLDLDAQVIDAILFFARVEIAKFTRGSSSNHLA